MTELSCELRRGEQWDFNVIRVTELLLLLGRRWRPVILSGIWKCTVCRPRARGRVEQGDGNHNTLQKLLAGSLAAFGSGEADFLPSALRIASARLCGLLRAYSSNSQMAKVACAA